MPGMVKDCGAEILSEEIARHEWENRFKIMIVKRLGPSLVPAEIVVPLSSLAKVFVEIESKVDQPIVKEGVIVKVRSNQDQMTVHLARQTDVTTDLPVVVLVDAYSASGSEVLCGALQDYKRATIAGAKTYGKGSVNILRPLDGGGIYVTTARWLTPNDRLIEGKGIEPDIGLDPQTDAVQWAIDYLHSR
jgi:carboxyl-terminal processing protease